MNLVIKDAAWQIAGRVASAIGGFLVITLITPYLGPLRFGDYSTILKYFAIWSAFADFGVYVIALKELGKVKKAQDVSGDTDGNTTLSSTYSKFVSLRFFMIIGVYTLALVIAYLIPAYSSNPYLIRGLPLGMVFSATFMSSGILQIPLQVFWKMEQVSIALILARVSQLAVIVATVYRLYTDPGFENGTGQGAFLLIVGSVVVSGLVQLVYTWRQGSKFLTFTFDRDRTFFKTILSKNRKYGLAYYLSSFHTLLVLMVFSRLYPTTQGFTYVGVRALALSLIEIMLIVPSALGNSLIHDVSGTDRLSQKNRYSALLKLVAWIGCVVMGMCALFAPHVIQLMGGSDYLTTSTSIGSDVLLPFLSFVLLLSFLRQVHNYLFVTTGHQNTLFGINLVGVTIGLIIGIPLIIHYNLAGGIATQILLEIVFLGGSLWVAHREKISLTFPWKIVLSGVSAAVISAVYLLPYTTPYVYKPLIWMPLASACVGILIIGSWKQLKHTLQQL